MAYQSLVAGLEKMGVQHGVFTLASAELNIPVTRWQRIRRADRPERREGESRKD